MNYETQEAQELNEKVANERVEAINKILTDYHIGAHVCGYDIGPSVTRFNIEYDPNVSSKSIEKYVQDMSRRLGGISARFAPVVLGQSYSGFEVPNATITTVGFKEIISSLPDVKKHPLANSERHAMHIHKNAVNYSVQDEYEYGTEERPLDLTNDLMQTSLGIVYEGKIPGEYKERRCGKSA